LRGKWIDDDETKAEYKSFLEERERVREHKRACECVSVCVCLRERDFIYQTFTQKNPSLFVMIV